MLYCGLFTAVRVVELLQEDPLLPALALGAIRGLEDEVLERLLSVVPEVVGVIEEGIAEGEQVLWIKSYVNLCPSVLRSDRVKIESLRLCCGEVEIGCLLLF